jgi:tyrosinase
MHFQSFALCSSVLASGIAAFTPASTTATDYLAAKGLLNLGIYEFQQAVAGNRAGCSLENVQVRREW